MSNNCLTGAKMDTQVGGGENNGDVEVAPALISVQPSQDSFAVAVGPDLRVFDFRGGCGVTLVDETGEFISVGDDKLVNIWSTGSWRCIASVCSEKRVSVVAIYDGMHACFADKFGAVGRWICMDLMETSHWKIQSLNPQRNVHIKISTTRGLGPNSVFKWYMAIAIVV
ncbi:PREDICTED: uncharacterized protein LOC105126971 [Populus euphratica]|uniref:Uncharacterized protein LOC105126971 n=1 Tax=Populus euphratica TaxID=75702 RepID=A0AAJ6XPC2_POPEU|nr:PREDICTED: uncharacterized protein LOC105126971 [Populus euphratica]